MKTFKFNDNKIAVILNALYPRYDDLEVAANNARNELLIASLRSELKDLKSVIEKFEKEN